MRRGSSSPQLGPSRQVIAGKSWRAPSQRRKRQRGRERPRPGAAIYRRRVTLSSMRDLRPIRKRQWAGGGASSFAFFTRFQPRWAIPNNNTNNNNNSNNISAILFLFFCGTSKYFHVENFPRNETTSFQ